MKSLSWIQSSNEEVSKGIDEKSEVTFYISRHKGDPGVPINIKDLYAVFDTISIGR